MNFNLKYISTNTRTNSSDENLSCQTTMFLLAHIHHEKINNYIFANLRYVDLLNFLEEILKIRGRTSNLEPLQSKLTTLVTTITMKK